VSSLCGQSVYTLEKIFPRFSPDLVSLIAPAGVMNFWATAFGRDREFYFQRFTSTGWPNICTIQFA